MQTRSGILRAPILQVVNMPNENQQTVVDWNLFKIRIANIKPYDGNVDSLNSFLRSCDDFERAYRNINDPNLHKLIFDLIKGKLVGKAEIFVGNRTELSNWGELKAALEQCFSDRRDLDCLVQELTRARPMKNENLVDYGTRLQLLRSQVAQRISNDTNMTLAEKTCQVSHYDKTALSTFIAGCTGTLRNNLHLKGPASLEDALAYVNQFENFEKLYGNLEDKPKTVPKAIFNNNSNYNNFQPPRPFQSNLNSNLFSSNPWWNRPHHPNNINYPMWNQPHSSNNFPNQPTSNNPIFNNQRYFQQKPFQKPNFSNQPINIQQLQAPPRRLPTNSETFRSATNVFQPRNTPSHLLPRPTPMSINSRNTFASQQPRQSNLQHRQPQQFRPQTIQEGGELLHNEYDYYQSDFPVYYESYPSENYEGMYPHNEPHQYYDQSEDLINSFQQINFDEIPNTDTDPEKENFQEPGNSKNPT